MLVGHIMSALMLSFLTEGSRALKKVSAVFSKERISLICHFFFIHSSFIPKFITHLFKCKPISMVGAEQVR